MKLERGRRGLAELVREAGVPVLEEVVVMGAAGLAGLAGHVLPAAALRPAEVREQPVGGRPAARVIARVGDESHLADRLLTTAGRKAPGQQAIEQLGRGAIALAERVRELDAMHAAPGPAGGILAVALL